MNTMNLKPAFEYRFKDLFKSIGVYFVILIVVFGGVLIYSLAVGDEGPASFSAFGMATAITLFVMGICNPRDHLRLCIQLGTGRLTAYVSEALSVILAGVALAVAGEAMIAIGQAIAVNHQNITVSDVYQLLYMGTDVRTLSFGQHLLSTCVSALLAISSYAAGAFLSLVFYRLSKRWRVVVAVGVPVLVTIVFPIVIARSGLGGSYSRFVFNTLQWVSEGPGNLMLLLAGAIVLLAIFNWLLTRKAPITKEKG